MSAADRFLQDLEEEIRAYSGTATSPVEDVLRRAQTITLTEAEELHRRYNHTRAIRAQQAARVAATDADFSDPHSHLLVACESSSTLAWKAAGIGTLTALRTLPKDRRWSWGDGPWTDHDRYWNAVWTSVWQMAHNAALAATTIDLVGNPGYSQDDFEALCRDWRDVLHSGTGPR